MRNAWTVRLGVLLYGSLCGLAYQFLKMDKGGDVFWSVRLPLALVLGVLFFYVMSHIGALALRFFLGRYDGDLQVRDQKTYWPLFFILLFPLQKMGMQESFFPYFLCIYAFAVFAMKCVLVARAKKDGIQEPGGAGTETSPTVGRGWICAAAFVVGAPLFWFHQFTLSFDDFFPFFRGGKLEGVYSRHNDVTRKTYPYDAEMEFERIPAYERSRAVVGYKIFKRSRSTAANAVPMNFDLRVTDSNGTPILDERLTLDAANEEPGKWHDFEFDLSGVKGAPVNFRFKIAPALLQMEWSYLLEFLFHNPLDFSFFENLSVRAGWSEPAIIPREKRGNNVILISLDTLRADFLGCYGYEKDVSPKRCWLLGGHMVILFRRRAHGA